MIFLYPAYLWGLLGLIVPIIIHLWSNKRGKVVKVGYTRFLVQSDAAQSSSIRLNEYLLLFLRLVIITLLVFIMAEPRIKTRTGSMEISYVIEESLLATPEMKKLAASFPNNSEIRLLKNGLPVVNLEDIRENVTDDSIVNHWANVEALNNLNSDSIVVITKGHLKTLKGKRPLSARKINWMILNPGISSSKDLALLQNEDQYSLLQSKSEKGNISFLKSEASPSDFEIQNDSSHAIWKNGIEDSLPIEDFSTKHIAIVSNDDFQHQTKIYKAAFRSIETYLRRTLAVTTMKTPDSLNAEDYDLIVWLTSDSTMDSSKNQIIFKPDSLATKTIVKEGRNIFRQPKLLTTESALEDHLMESLIDILYISETLSTIVKTADERVVNESEISPIVDTNKESLSKEQTKSILTILLAILGFTLLGERILARKRSQ